MMSNTITARNLGIMNMNGERNTQIRKKANVHFSKNEGESSETMFLSCHHSKDTHNNDLPFLDSGYNNHMTSNKNINSYLDASITS